jgi:hypothetical protein
VERQRRQDAGPSGPAAIDRSLPEVTRVTPSPRGRGLPVPPVVPTVAVFCLLVGISLGYGAAPRGASPVPSPSPSPAATNAAVVTTDPPFYVSPIIHPYQDPMTQLVTPPGDGLTLTQALAQLAVVSPDVQASQVISARVTRLVYVSGYNDGLGDRWVWAIVVPSTTWELITSDGSTVTYYSDPNGDAVTASPGAIRVASTEMIVLDYYTGALLESHSPA